MGYLPSNDGQHTGKRASNTRQKFAAYMTNYETNKVDVLIRDTCGPLDKLGPLF
jgi:hypothetical protein